RARSRSRRAPSGTACCALLRRRLASADASGDRRDAPRPSAAGTLPRRSAVLAPLPAARTRRPREADLQAWEYGDVLADHGPAGRLYHEFLRVPDLSAGIYVLEAGGTDPQSPHTEDELYYVIAGRSMVTVGDETRPV